MKVSRLAGLIFLVALTVSLMTAAAAFASEPQFTPGTLNPFFGESGLGTLEAGGEPVTCHSDTNTGEITGPKTVGSVVVMFYHCTATKETATCPVNSPGDVAELITTNVLKGELGTVKTSEAASGVGLLLEPASGTEFVKLEGTCLLVTPSPVDGTIAGESSPLNTTSKDGKLLFTVTGGAQAIKKISVLGSAKSPVLKALGLLEATEQTSELVLYENAVAVT